jgi:hypothetical protein
LISKAEFEKEGLLKLHSKESKRLTDFIPIIIGSVYGKLQILHFYAVRCDKCYKLDQQNAHTIMFSFTKLLHVSGLIGPSSESAVVKNNRQAILSSPICGTVVG